MNCGELLVFLLALADPSQVTEDEIRLAIDLAAKDLQRGGTLVLEDVHRGSQKELLRLLSENPAISAVQFGDDIYVRRVSHGQ